MSKEADLWILAAVIVVLVACCTYLVVRPATVVVKCYDGQLWTTYWKKGRHKDRLILVDDKPVDCK